VQHYASSARSATTCAGLTAIRAALSTSTSHANCMIRAASGIEDHPLDVARVPLDPIHTSANHPYLCCKWHVRSGGTHVDERLNTTRGAAWALVGHADF
jgi:hypothetical protein